MSSYLGSQRFAHRGVVQAAPENTLESFRGAVDAGGLVGNGVRTGHARA